MRAIKLVWDHLGLQARIMAYVTAGLALLFGGLVYFNMLGIREAREQAFRERSVFAEVLAHDVGQDFEFLVSDLELAMENLKNSGDDPQ